MSQTLEARIRTTAVVLLIALIGAAAGRPARAAADDPGCKPWIDAMMKQTGTPTHVVLTETTPFRNHGKPTTMEMIYINDGDYIQIEGRWTHGLMSHKAMRQQEEENRRNAKSLSCRYLRDEAVGGETAAVYLAQAVTEEDVKTATTIWVSKRTGLPLKNDTRIGPSDKESIHTVMIYDYANVHAPAGVK
jgi:hypothetical protein